MRYQGIDHEALARKQKTPPLKTAAAPKAKQARQPKRKQTNAQPKGPGCLGWIQIVVMLTGITLTVSGRFLIGIPLIVIGLAIGSHQYKHRRPS